MSFKFKYILFLAVFCLGIFFSIDFSDLRAAPMPGPAKTHPLKKLPPSWDITPPKSNMPSPEPTEKPWYIPRVGLGINAMIPEILPIDAYLFFGRYFALRAFYAPPIKKRVRVELPSDLIKTYKDILGIVNPDILVKFNAVYGPHYGLEGLFFPFGNVFFVSAGVNYRKISITGHGSSAVLICSIEEAAKEPPCGNEEVAFKTTSELVLDASVESTAFIMRGGFGALWEFFDNAFLKITLGVVKPVSVKRNLNVNATIDAASDAYEEELMKDIAAFRAEKEKEMKDKAISAMDPVEKRWLPIVGVGVGVLL